MEDDQNFSLPGFPPLPKCLVAAIRQAKTSSPLSHAHRSQDPDLYVGASTSAAAAAMQGHRGSDGSSHQYGSLSPTQEPLSNRKSIHIQALSSHNGGHLAQYQQQQQQQQYNSPCTDNDSPSGSSTTLKLDTQLAILRQEMYGLRQMDLSLLWQFQALNESIQEFKVYIQELGALSPSSPSPTPSETNSPISEPDEESYSGQNSGSFKLPQQPPVAISSSFSSKNSSMSKHHHQHYNNRSNLAYTGRVIGSATCSMPPPVPQKTHLPRILQERMRRAPPPPPPNRPKSSKSGSSNSLSHGGGHHHSKTTSKSSSPAPSAGPTNASGISRRSLSCQFSLLRAKAKILKGKHTRAKD